MNELLLRAPLSGVPGKKSWLRARAGVHYLIHVDAEETGGLYSVVEIVSNPSDGTPLHVHEPLVYRYSARRRFDRLSGW